MQIHHPYLLFLGDVKDQLAAKTAQGVVDWRRDWCLGQLSLPNCQADLGLPEMSIADAVSQGAKTFVLGVVNPGGFLPDHWIDIIVQAIQAGMDIASGLHVRLESIPQIAEAAAQKKVNLINLRASQQSFKTGNGLKRAGKRILAMGTDCSVGKKYTALCLERDMVAAGFSAEFCATGQTGLLISGRGVALDAVIADFIAGAAEWISPEGAEDHWYVIEGQGSLGHPSFAGVTLGLLHGSQPDAFVVCHEPTRKTMRNVDTPVAEIQTIIDQTISLGRLTNPDIQCVGICINSQALSDSDAQAYLQDISEKYQLPATDPMRYGCGPIIAKMAQIYGKAGD